MYLLCNAIDAMYWDFDIWADSESQAANEFIIKKKEDSNCQQKFNVTRWSSVSTVGGDPGSDEILMRGSLIRKTLWE